MKTKQSFFLLNLDVIKTVSLYFNTTQLKPKSILNYVKSNVRVH